MEKDQVRFSQRVVSGLLSLLLITQPVLPAIAATITPSGNTQMDKAGNGVPVVNIATPNQSGISHNKYNDYNVGKEGLILNNATGKLNQTQLGGLIQNNPNLKAGQEAKGIINEVTGTNRSQLQGYTEVAGKAANVIVANPYGITCNGCGFINTPNATLTTGKPVLDANGKLQSLDVTKGSITIEGQGLDGSQSDAVSIIARATEINAALHAKDLTVTAGANRVSASGETTALKGEGDAPKVAVDTGALGGMYANRIHLVSSEKGLGVNLGNLNARQGDITLSSSGKLVVKNSLASGNTTATGTDITLSGEHKAGGNMTAHGQTALTLDNAQLAADKNLQLTTDGKLTQIGGLLTAGVDTSLTANTLFQHADAQAGAGRNLTVSSAESAELSGKNVAKQDATVSAKALTTGIQLTAARHLSLNASQRATLNGSVVAGQQLTAKGGALTQNGSLSATDITLSGQTLNQAGDSKTSATGNIALTTTGAATLNGSTVVGQSLSINSASLDNGGMLAAGAHASIRTGTLINNGAIQGNSLDVTGTDITSSGSLKSASVLDIHARNAMLSGNIGAKGNTTVSVSGKLDNGGQMVSDGGMTLTAGQINNHGTFSGASGLSATADIYTAAAASVLHSDGALSMAAGDATLAGETSASGSLAVKGSSLKTLTTAQTQGASVSVDVLSAQLDGSQVAQGALTLKVRDSLLHGGKTSAATLKANGDGITNSGTLLASDVELNAQNLVNTGTLQGRDAFTLQTGTLDNQSGATIAAPKTTINGQRLMSAGMIQGTTLNISAGQQLSNSGVLSAPQLMVRSPEMVNSGVMQGDNVSLYAGNLTSNGTLSSNGALTITADSFNQQGKTGAKGDMQLTVSQLLANSGSLVSDSNLTVTAADLQQNGTLTGATALAVSADTITNGTSSLTQSAGNMAFSGDAIALAGNVWAGGNLTLKGTTLKSAADAQIQSGGNVLLSGNNATMAGVMIAASHMGITTRDSFSNSGQLQGASLSVDSAEVVNNGDLSSTGSLDITAKNFIQQGNVGARGNTQLAIDQHLNNSGTLVSDGTLLITAGDVNQSGTLTGAQLLDLTSATLNTTAGSLTQSAGDIGLSSSGAMALAGEIWAEGNLRLTGNTLNSAATALMQSEGSLTMKGQNASLAGTHIAAGELSIDMSDTLVHDGKSRGDTLSIVAPALTNSGMLLASALTVDSDSLTNSSVLQGESTTLQTAIFNNLAGGTLYSGADLTLSVPDITNNGLVNSDGTLTLDTFSLNNTGKLIANALALKTNELKGDGLLQGATAMTLQGDSLTQGAAGRWLTGGLLDIRSGQLSTSGTTQGQSVALNATSWTHEGSLLGLGQFAGTIASILNNSGDILSQGLLALSGDSLTNTGSILAAGLASLSGNQLTNRGAVQGDTLTLKHTAVDNAGTMVGLTGLTLDDKGILTNSGKLLSQGALTVNATDVTNSGSWQGNTLDLTANSLNNSGALQSANALQMALTGDLTSTQNSKITALGEMTLRAAGLNNQGLWSAKTQKIDGTTLNNSGEISGVDGLVITLKDEMQQQGKILTGGSLNVTTTALTNSGQIQGAQSVVNALTLENSGRVQGDNDLTLTLVQALTNHASGTILAQKTLALATPKLINDGIIQGNGATTFDIKQQVINNGKLLSGAALTLTTADYSGAGWLQATDLILNVAKLANTGTTIAGNQATLKGSSLTNSGTFQAAMLDVNYQTLINRGTLLGNNSLKVTSGALSQDNGKLYSGGDLLIDATTLTGAGDVVAMGNLTAKLIGAFSTQGVMAAGQQLALTSNGDITNQNTLQGNSLTLTAGGKLINNGTLTVGSDETTLSGSQIDLNASGSLQAGGNVTLTSSSDITVKGFTGTAGSLTLNAAGTLLNAALLYAGQNMQLFAARIHNLRGDILAGDSLWMQKDASGAANEEVVNTSGTIETQRGDIAVNTGYLLNTMADFNVITSGQSAVSDYDWLTPADARIPLSYFKDGQLGLLVYVDMIGNDGVASVDREYVVPWQSDATEDFVISESSTSVSGSGPAARIAAGRDLSVTATQLDNTVSTLLAARDITLTGDTLNNQSAQTGTVRRYQTYVYNSIIEDGDIVGWKATAKDSKIHWSHRLENDGLYYIATGDIREEKSDDGQIYRAVIQAGGTVNANFASNISNFESAAEENLPGHTLAAPALNVPSAQQIGNGATLQVLTGPASVGLTQPDWQDMTNSTLQDVNGHNTSLSQDGNAGSTINGGNGSSIAQSGV
jgi:filamentous haemagglutinin family N-terminal domain